MEGGSSCGGRTLLEQMLSNWWQKGRKCSVAGDKMLLLLMCPPPLCKFIWNLRSCLISCMWIYVVCIVLDMPYAVVGLCSSPILWTSKMPAMLMDCDVNGGLICCCGLEITLHFLHECPLQRLGHAMSGVEVGFCSPCLALPKRRA